MQRSFEVIRSAIIPLQGGALAGLVRLAQTLRQENGPARRLPCGAGCHGAERVAQLHPLVAPQVLHFMQVPFLTSV